MQSLTRADRPQHWRPHGPASTAAHSTTEARSHWVAICPAHCNDSVSGSLERYLSRGAEQKVWGRGYDHAARRLASICRRPRAEATTSSEMSVTHVSFVCRTCAEQGRETTGVDRQTGEEIRTTALSSAPGREVEKMRHMVVPALMGCMS